MLASIRCSAAATCPALVGALATIVSGETEWTVSSAVAGAPLLGGKGHEPGQYNCEMASTGVGTSGLLPQCGLYLEPIDEGVQQVWSITCAVCSPPPPSALPEGAHLGGGCTISPVLAPQECAAITSGATITIEDCADAAAQTFDFIGTVAS
ncbi:hypothetical protein C8J57DRAFT_1493353 [Mycena rebaudengoi]|nr:hypothetical protein C8J57DRAFT_1493353 [Mycena rebaudengoi]